MKIYTVHLWFNGDQKFNVEARDTDHAEEVAIDMLYEELGSIPVEVTDVEAVFRIDDQYTDQQELEDREGLE